LRGEDFIKSANWKQELSVDSSPCQRQCKLLPSLGARRLSFVVGRPLTIHILIFSSETPQPNEVQISKLTKAVVLSFRRRVLEIGQSETRTVCGDHVYLHRVTYFVINEYKIKILHYKKNLPLLN
jgi:hypothetical protein